MGWRIAFCLLFFSAGVYAQPFIYLQTGRPNSLERNNAFRSVGKDYDLIFAYEGGDVYDEKIHGTIDHYNDSILLLAQIKHPQLTFDRILQFVDDESRNQEKASALVQSSFDYKGWKSTQQSTDKLLFSRKRNSLHYAVYRIYQENSTQGISWKVAQVFRCNLRNNRVKQKQQVSADLPFTFPVNGIR